MKINILIERENKNLIIDIPSNTTVSEVLKKLKITSTTVVTAINDGLVTLDTKLKDKDNLKILSVISGG